MKRNFKSVAILVLVATLLCAMLALASCDGKPKDSAITYEVTVLTAENAPAAGVKASFVEIEEGMAHEPVVVSANERGVASFKCESGNPVDVTLSDIPAGYVVPEGERTLRLTKDASKATVTLEAIPDDSPDLEYSAPLSGSGTAKYVSGNSGQLEYASFKPYVVVEGNYKFRFENAEQRIYLQFNSQNREKALYLIYSRGNADVSVQMLSGSTIGGIFNPGELARDNDDRPQFNDNKSLADKNFELEFSNNESATMGNSAPGVFYFELALEDAGDVGKAFAVTFEKLDKPYVPKPPTVYTDVHATNAPTKAKEGAGTLHQIPTNCANFVVVKAADGTYHLSSETGPLLYANRDGPWPCGATLVSGESMTCIKRISGGTNPYRWVTTLSNEGNKGENWLPFLCDYVGYSIDSDGTPVAPGAKNENTGFVNNKTSKCNSDGYYPLNEQIVKFLTLLYNDIEIQHFYFTTENYMGTTWFLPKGYEWLFLCGYYGDEYNGEDFGGKGTESDPYTLLREGTFEVDVPAGGKTYFETGRAYLVSSVTAGATLEYNGQTYGADGHGFAATIYPDATEQSKKFNISIQGGAAGKVTLVVGSAVTGDGSISDPYMQNKFEGSYGEHVKAEEQIWYSVVDATGKFKFTAHSAGMTFAVYDIDGWAAIARGEEAEALFVFTSTADKLSCDFELDGNNYFIAVSFTSAADIEWDISKSE